MKERYFFERNENNDKCYMLKYWKVTAEERNAPIEIEGAKINYGNGAFYCAFYGLTGFVADSDCGSDCPAYNPRNGKNGRCIESKNCYEPNNIFYKIYPDGGIEISSNKKT